MHLYPKYLLAQLYNEKGEIDKASKMANTILNMPVKVPSMATREIKDKMKQIIQN